MSSTTILARPGTSAQEPWEWALLIGMLILILFLSFAAVGWVARRQRKRHGVQIPRSADVNSVESSSSPYSGLDDDERAEAMAYEADLRSDPARARLLHGEVPTRPGTVLTSGSYWPGVALVTLAFSVFGAVVQNERLIAAAGVVLAIGMFVHGRGPARRIELSEHGDLIIYGGLWGRTVHLRDFNWARAYMTPNWMSAKRASTVVLQRQHGRHLFGKVIGLWFATVSSRRATIVLASLWRCPATGQRVSDNTMADFVRHACRDSGMRVVEGSGLRIWTTERPG